MKLEGEKWQNYSTKHIEENHKTFKNQPEYLDDLRTYSVKELMMQVLGMIEFCEMNKFDPEKVPVLMLMDDDKDYVIHSCLHGVSNIGPTMRLHVSQSDKLDYTAPDSRPEKGEYWSSRGICPSISDYSGFVVSFLAGRRLDRMVKYVLEKDETESHLDYREQEPDFIQYKFSAEEFDVEKLHEKTKEKGGIITEEILRECIL